MLDISSLEIFTAFRNLLIYRLEWKSQIYISFILADLN